MLQYEFHIALSNNCDINIKGIFSFEEEIIQKIVCHLVQSCK
jgi:hypothetical protein